MDILIKSFTRPYYLDKCIQSIKDHISGNFAITVLDDGTPQKYLDEILRRHPGVEIRKSPFYEDKVCTIERHMDQPDENLPQMQIPSKFWQENAAHCSDYFLLLEDDMWITEKIDISDIEMMMRSHNIAMVKTALFGMEFYKKFDTAPLGRQLTEIKPDLKTFSPFIFRKIYVENTFKSYGILLRLGLAHIKKFLPIYAVYMVAGAFYEKKYYKYLWNNYEGGVNENHQLYRVITWNKKYPEKKYARMRQDSLTTSFSSSATNRYDGILLNPFVYNQILSDAWIRGMLPIGYNHQDFDENLITGILEAAQHPLATVVEWKKWTDRFRQQYRDVGFNI